MSRISHSPGHCITRTAFALMARGNEELKKIGITGAQFYVMQILWEHEGEKMTLKQIKDAMDIKPPSLTKLINRLEHKGYITRSTDPSDKRSSIITLTESAEYLKEEMMKFMDGFTSKFHKGITKAELDTLERVLLRMQENLSRM
ncbi:MAG: MarR family transcriptional regulator [Spirochaetes bacterium]|nr:MarR family transcriptional regulator [Spirochaetota bacterium]